MTTPKDTIREQIANLLFEIPYPLDEFVALLDKAVAGELRDLLQTTIGKDKKPGDLDKDGNRMQSKVRTGYNYAKAEMRHILKDRLATLESVKIKEEK